MKSIYFYSLAGSESDTIRGQLDGSGLSYTELRLDQDFRQHPTEHPGLPEVIVDVDNQVYSEFPTPYDHTGFLSSWTSAPAALPTKPMAKVITKNDLGTEQDMFVLGDAITLRVEIWESDMSAIKTDFAGTFYVPFFDAQQITHWVHLNFTAGIAERAINNLEEGQYKATTASSTLVVVRPHEIIIAI
jgi:hypothetical protein